MQAPSRTLFGAVITVATLIVCFMGIRFELDAARKTVLRAGEQRGATGAPQSPALSANRETTNDVH